MSQKDYWDSTFGGTSVKFAILTQEGEIQENGSIK